ncbi:MAG: class I SAM-dependent methyltransferase, partial [Chloroflexi bacterium]|nr:class I SAM-dependent methyltransferase [Chloroflexota bacterium]
MTSPSVPSSAYAGDPAQYHRSRGIPPWVLEQAAQRLVAALPHARAGLEIGIGTGRVGAPLARHLPLVGVDLSERMLRFLQQRVDRPAALSLVLADACRLPFPQARFDVVISVHMLHLVADVDACLREARRVTRPPGWFALGLLEHAAGSPVTWAQSLWRRLLLQRGYPASHPGWRSYAFVQGRLEALGARLRARLATDPWVRWLDVREVWRAVRTKRFSPYWGLPPGQHRRLSRQLARAFQQRYGWQPRVVPDVRRFVWYLYQWS